MSELINQPGVTDGSAAKALRAVMLSPKKAIREALLRESGVDVDMLVQTYNEAVNPYLDYLDGYLDLMALEPAGGGRSIRNSKWDEELEVMVAPEPWDHFLMRSKVLPAADKQVVQVINGADLYCFVHDLVLPQYVRITVYLTRKGQWILWYGTRHYQHSPDLASEEMFLFETVREFWDKLHDLVPDEYKLTHESGGSHNSPQYLPLYIEKKLRALVKSTVGVRQRRVDTMKSSLSEADARTDSVQFPHR